MRFMKKVNISFLSLLFFSMLNCYSVVYHIELTEPISDFFKKKSELYMKHPDSQWKINVLSEREDLGKELIRHIKSFITHNDRDSTDSYEVCCFTKMLSDKRIMFSENDMQTILKVLKILAVWFWRDEIDVTPKEREMFKTFDFSTLFIPDEEKNVCAIL